MAILNLKKMTLGKILHTLWKLLPLTHMNQNQSSKKLYTTFPPFVKFPPDYFITRKTRISSHQTRYIEPMLV